MDGQTINRLLATPGEESDAKAVNPWQMSFTMRPKAVSHFSDDQSNNPQRASAFSFSSSPPHLSQTDNYEASSDSEESLQTPPSIKHSLERQLTSSGSPFKEVTDTYGEELRQIDGADDIKRALPVTRNHFLTDSVPNYTDIVSDRRLHRIQLETGALDFAYVRVPLPQGIVSAVFKSSPRSYSLLRRSSDGYFSAMAMFKAAFPSATAEEAHTEREYIKSIPTTKPGVNDDNCWIDPAFALGLAEEYCLVPYVQALLDPADITIQTSSADGSYQHIAAPPKYPPTSVVTPPATPDSKTNAVIQLPRDGSPIGPDGKPMSRMFDPRLSLKHQGVPGHLLTMLNPSSHVRHVQYVNPATKMLEPDLSSLVVTIDGVVYTRGGSHRQGGATVFFHHTCPWTSLAYLQERDPHTREQALLEGLCQALIMIEALVTADPLLQEVRIMTSSRELCMLFGLGIDRIGDEHAGIMEEWLSQTDMTYWEGIERRWTEITRGKAGRPVDVRLWLVAEDMIQPATEMAIAEMYRADGRDWYEENGKGHDPLKPDASSDPAVSSNSNSNFCGTDIALAVETKARHFLDQMAFVRPQSIVDQGSQAVAKWEIETRARYKQAMLLLDLAAREYERVTSTAWNDPGRGRPHKEHWEVHSRVMALARARQDAAVYFAHFMAEHPVLRRSEDIKVEEDISTMGVDAAGRDLIQNVVKMVQEDEELNQSGDEMEWE